MRKTRTGSVASEMKVRRQLKTSMTPKMPTTLSMSARLVTRMSMNSWSWYTSFCARDITEPTLLRLWNDMGSRWRWANSSRRRS